MDKNKILKAIKGQSEKDAITTILSACADYGGSDGAMVSVRRWENVANLISAYYKKFDFWIKYEGNEKLFNERAEDNCLCRWDNGMETYLDDYYSAFAKLTHFKLT